MDETLLNAKRGVEGLSSFQNVPAHDLVYWDYFSLQVVLMKHILSNWNSLHARLNSHYKAWSYKKKKRSKIKNIHKISLERTYS